MSSSKGSQFEREFCTRLSLWWSSGARDDLFWRSAGSGGRATNRSKRGKSTANAHGDVVATDPSSDAHVLLDAVTFELKRGYKDAHLGFTFDKPHHLKDSPLEQMIEQAQRSAANADTPFWSLVVKRDRREAVVYLPLKLWVKLGKPYCDPYAQFRTPKIKRAVCALWLTQFFELTPALFKHLR